MLEAPLSTLGTTSGHCAKPQGLDTHMPGKKEVEKCREPLARSAELFVDELSKVRRERQR